MYGGIKKIFFADFNAFVKIEILGGVNDASLCKYK